ncbi:hypothetical protein ACHAXT_003309 [Thalassiosira profunda]
MSSRALRRLREEKEAALAEEEGSGEEESSEEEEARGGAFMDMLEEESSSEEESDSDDDDGDKESAPVATSPAKPKKGKPQKPPKEEEDLDAILSDLKIQSGHPDAAGEGETSPSGPPTIRSLLLSRKSGYDLQDLDLDHAMRSLLGGAAGGNPHMGDDFMDAPPPQQGRRQRGGQPRGRRTLAKKYLFGKPRTEWGKPPSYVGGGIGTKELTAEAVEEERNAWSVPWPYNLTGGEEDAESDNKDDDTTAMSQSMQRWYTLQMSDTYTEHNYIYQEMLSHSPQAGAQDPNALAMFVADHPYFAETILQLAMVLFYVNDRGKGSDLLRRCMFLFETALPSNVLPGSDDGENGNGGKEILMDVDRQPNSGLFAALFRIMQTSGMSGCHDSALATGRFLLSLDPLRDPMGVLLILDYYALASRRTVLAVGEGGEVEAGAAFIVNLVESDLIAIHFKDPLTDRHHRCRLLDMPNWAYSYALALHRLSMNEDDDSEESYEERAQEALVGALEKFPVILPKVLTMNKINTKDRSFRMDWPAILPHFGGDTDEANAPSNNTVEERVSKASGGHLCSIFVQRCHKLWKEDSVVQWMFQCAEKVVQKRLDGTESDESMPPMTSTFSPALARYAQCDPSEYEDAFRTFPPEAIALDPNIVAPAMALGPGRRGRLFRRGQQHQRGAAAMAGMEGQDPLEAVRQILGLGNGGGAADVLDPDSPLLQLYLQSLLPWAQVEGVRPPPGG